MGNRTHQTGLLLLWLVLAAAAENREPTENEKWATQMNLEYMSPGEPVRNKPRHKCSGMSQLETLKGEWVRGSCHNLTFIKYIPRLPFSHLLYAYCYHASNILRCWLVIFMP